MARGNGIGLAHRRPGGDVHRLALVVHRGARERHPVLPANQAAHWSEGCRVRSQRRSVTARPDQPLAMCRYQLAVDERHLTRAQQQLAVVEARSHTLVRPDADQCARAIDQILYRREARIADADRFFKQHRMQRARARMIPERRAWRFVEPEWVAAKECLAEGDDLRALIERRFDHPRQRGQAPSDRERDRCGLDDSRTDAARISHADGGRRSGSPRGRSAP